MYALEKIIVGGEKTEEREKSRQLMKRPLEQVVRHLQVQDVTSELKVCQGTVDLHKEKKKGSQVIIAHLFTSQGAPLCLF